MSIISFLHEPAWNKLNVANLIGAAGLIAAAGLRISYARLRKLDIYKPDVLLAETHGVHVDEIVLQRPTGDLDTRSKALSKARRKSIILATLALAAALASFLYAIRSYIILYNWDDGERKAAIGDQVGAMVCYRKALRADKSLFRTHLLLGLALLQSGKTAASVAELEQAATASNASPDAYVSLGDAFQILGRNREAAGAYSNAIKLDSTNVLYYIALGNCHEQLSEPEAAYQDYEHAIASEPKNFVPHVRIGNLLIRTRHFDEGFAHIKRAVTLAPNNPVAHNAMATAYSKRGMYRQAIDEYKRALQLNPKFAVCWYDLGVTFASMGERTRAVDAFHTCVGVKPSCKADNDAIEKSRLALSRISD